LSCDDSALCEEDRKWGGKRGFKQTSNPTMIMLL
ncbi:MAG: hypothetical protein ACI8RD_004052, partial [Bacillariaceae sp.]